MFLEGIEMADITFSKLNSESMVQQTINFLTDAIVRRELQPGSKIPPELELSEKLGVSRNTVREAVKILVFMGVLEIRRPEGTFVRSGFTESLIDPMIYGIILNQGNSYETLMELREMIESGVMRLVMEKATDDQIETLREPLETLKNVCAAKQPDLDAIMNADDEFHMAVNNLGGNEMVNKISNTVRVLTHAMRYESVDGVLKAGKAMELYAAHEKLFEMLKHRDAAELNYKVRSTYFVDGKPLLS